MKFGKCPPILETRNVLLDHLLGNVIYFVNDRNCAKDISLKISQPLSDKDIITLLQNKGALKEAISNYNGSINFEKENLGEKLFSAVSEMDSEMCAQITGMLLELNVADIQNLLTEPNLLVQAVQKARQEYLKFIQKDSKSVLGEELYDLVLKQYPDPKTAGHLTGMLLELDVPYIKTIISNPSELSAKLDTAYKSFTNITVNKN